MICKAIHVIQRAQGGQVGCLGVQVGQGGHPGGQGRPQGHPMRSTRRFDGFSDDKYIGVI